MTKPNFKISSFCHTGTCCVGVAFEGDSVLVTNTTTPGSSTISFTKDEWQAFVAGVKNNEFNV